MSSRSIDDVLKAHTNDLMAIPGVVGIAMGELKGKPCIVVFVRENNTRLERKIPARLEGHPVKIEAVGEIRPMN